MTDDLGPEYRADKYSDAQRKDLAAKGFALPDGSFPIMDAEDLANAVRLIGLGNNPKSDVKAFIVKRAKALNLTAKLPADWRSKRKPRSRAVDVRRPEVRFMTVPDLEVRSTRSVDSDDIVLTGHPIVYNQPYTVMGLTGPFEERMDSGVVRNVLASNPDVVFAFNHRTDDLPLARTTSGTLKLIDGPTALGFEARLDGRQQVAQDLAIAIERGDVSQMSVGFTVESDTWNTAETERRIHSLGHLFDVSAVTYPASPTTHIEVAQRMLASRPIETFADLDKIFVELRNVEQRKGAVLNQSLQAKLLNATQTLHDVLAAGGADFDHSADDDPDADENDGLQSFAMEDGTEDDSTEMDSDFDASMVRSAALSLEAELLELESRSAAAA
jgi:HK97 family phage prohead protease